jgi:hypothetical protein
MTANDKANELFNEMFEAVLDKDEPIEPKSARKRAKAAALIAANEVANFCTWESSAKEDFWLDVIKELKKMDWCEHTWIRTTKDYKPAWKCFNCGVLSLTKKKRHED